MDGSIDDNTSLCDSNSGTPKSKSALSRHRLKMEDPESYRRYLDKQKTRAKQRREELKRELQKKKGNEQAIAKKAHQNELQRLRQKRYMEKKKKEGINIKSSTPSSKAKPQTRNFIETIREYNRQKKRKEREKMSWQKKMWVRKKDRERKQEKRKEAAKLKVLISSPSSTVQSTVGSPFGSKKTEYNITSKVRKSLPKSPAKFAKVFNNLLSTASPRKKEAMKKLKKLNLTPRFQLARQALAVKQASRSSKSSVIVAEHLSKRYRRGQIAGRKGSLKKRKSHVDRNSIQNFFFREDISRVLPGKRYATKEGPGYALQVSLKAAHVKYLAENPAKRVSLGKFAALRPRNVRLLRVSDREFCCCVYCINVRYKMLCLSQALADKDKKKTCEMDILDIVLCPKRNGQRYHEPDCINGKCSDCRDYMATMNVYYESIPEDKNLTWTRWGYRDSGKGKHKREVVTKRGNKHECLDEFLENDLKRPVQGTSFFQHVTTAQWQSSQFRQIKDKLPTGEVLQVMDFAKNREVKYQDEIKGAFYTAGQITMHPIITYYKSENGLVRNASIVISEDNDHDHFAVQHFQKITSPEIEKKLGASVKRKVIFSDGCSSQYKSKGPFAELAGSSDVVNRNYFGSEHGKSECDAEMGLVNRCVDRAIVANQVVINNAQDLYQYCKTNLESDSPFSKRTFHLVKLGEIDRKRPAIMKAQTVQNTRKIHQAVNLQTGNTLKVRSLSCFCTKCEAGDPDCLNSNYVDSYREITLKEQTKSNKSSADESKNFTSEKPKASKTRQKTESPKRGETEQSEETPEINKMGGSKTTKAENERHQYFSSLIAIMEQAGTEGFEKLKEVSLALQTEINEMYPSEIVNCQFSFADRKYKADQIALTLFPEDIRNGGLLPVNVTADGNCLPRTGSILSFGNESAHEEMRVRIAIELCLNLDLYIDNNYLNRGENFPEQESKSLDKTYTMFSEQYVPGTKITKRVTEKIFKEETVKICKTAEYMGIWQLFALSSVLQKKISSVYPNLGQSSVRQLLNRNILPRQGDHMEQGVTVMWTSTRTDMEPQNWIPNHFVPLLPVTRLPYLPEMLGDLSGMVDDIEFNEEDTEISLDDHMMDTIFDILSVTDDIYPTPTPDGAPMPGGTEPTANPNPTPEGIKTTPDGTPTPEHTESSTGTDDVNPTPIPDGPPMPGGTEPTANPNPTTEGIKTTPDGTSTPEHTESSTGTDDVNATPTPDGPPMPGGTEPIANRTPTHEGIKTTPDGTPTPEYTESRFRTGDYVLVEHGKCLYPAVVDSWPWVIFFTRKKKKGLWTLNDIKHTVVYQDIQHKLQPPDIVMCGGTRILYQFKDDLL